MKSAQMRKYGGSGAVEINQSVPSAKDPSAGKVLVNVKAASVNPAEWKIREGYMQKRYHFNSPDFGNRFFWYHRKVGEVISNFKQGDDDVYG
jgi:alcohol dehydrogenase